MRATQKLRAARQLRGLSAEEVGKRVGIDTSTVYRLEKRMPKSIEQLISIVRLYDVTPNDIFLDKGMAK